MFDVKQYYVAQAETYWEKIRLKYGFFSMPVDFLAKDIADFMNEKDNLKIGQTVMFPNVYFARKLESADSEAFPLSLRDSSSSGFVVWARYTAVNKQAVGFLEEGLNSLYDNNLYFPIIQNGVHWPFQDNADNRIYLIGFQGPTIKKSNFDWSKLTEPISKLFPDSNYIPDLVPVNDL